MQSSRATQIRDLHLADAVLAAALHSACFEDDPWPVSAFSDLLVIPGTFGLLAIEADAPLGLLLCRAVADECEILTLAVLATAQRQGIGRSLLLRGLEHAEELGARRVFLEVAVDNTAAIGLYRCVGFTQTALRPAYYRRSKPQTRVDAAVMSLVLGGCSDAEI